LDQILVQSGAGGGGGGVFFRKLEKPESKLDLVYVSLAKSVQNKTGSKWSFGSRL
jgi:hypothetical protein